MNNDGSDENNEDDEDDEDDRGAVNNDHHDDSRQKWLMMDIDMNRKILQRKQADFIMILNQSILKHEADSNNSNLIPMMTDDNERLESNKSTMMRIIKSLILR